MPEWYAPLDPDCPDVRKFVDTLLDDPMTAAYGAPVAEITEGFEKKHRATCQRCQAYGAANIEVR